MADVHTPEVRSYNMSRIKAKDTKPEELVRKYLFAAGLRYRKNDKRLPGKPDIVFPRYRTVVFVNGCFWHGHEGCKYFKWPGSNKEFWEQKIRSNQERDERKKQELQNQGWYVITIWECTLKSDAESTLSTLLDEIKRQSHKH